MASSVGSQDALALKEMFSTVDMSLINVVLSDAGGNMDRAIDALLQLSTLDSAGPLPSAPPSKPPAAPAPALAPAASAKPSAPASAPPKYDQEFDPRGAQPAAAAPDAAAPGKPKELTQEEADALLAKQLQEEFNVQSASDEEYVKRLMREEQDAALAQQLAGEGRRSAARAAPVPEGKFQPDMSIGDFLGAVGEEEMNELMTTIKEHLIPLIVQQLKTVELPAINEEIESGSGSGSGSKISFTVSNIALDDIDVPAESVVCNLVPGHGIRVQLSDITAKIKKFDWSYKKESFPKLKDDGHAKAALSDTTITVHINIVGNSLGTARVTVGDCVVKIGKLDVKIGGTMASFIYNIVIAAFSSSIRKSLEAAAQDMIRDTVRQNAAELLSPDTDSDDD